MDRRGPGRWLTTAVRSTYMHDDEGVNASPRVDQRLPSVPPPQRIHPSPLHSFARHRLDPPCATSPLRGLSCPSIPRCARTAGSRQPWPSPWHRLGGVPCCSLDCAVAVAVAVAVAPPRPARSHRLQWKENGGNAHRQPATGKTEGGRRKAEDAQPERIHPSISLSSEIPLHPPTDAEDMRKGSASRRCMPPVSAGVANPIVQRARQSHPLSYKHTNAVRYVEIRRHCREPTAAFLAVAGFASFCFFSPIALQCRPPPLACFVLDCRRTWAHVTREGICIKIDLALHVILYHDRLSSSYRLSHLPIRSPCLLPRTPSLFFFLFFFSS